MVSLDRGIHQIFYMTKDDSMLEAMETYGGSFVKALANAMRHADPNNYTKLVSAFSNYVSEYRKMAKDMKDIKKI